MLVKSRMIALLNNYIYECIYKLEISILAHEISGNSCARITFDRVFIKFSRYHHLSVHEV
jgi:hypothetical protein